MRQGRSHAPKLPPALLGTPTAFTRRPGEDGMVIECTLEKKHYRGQPEPLKASAPAATLARHVSGTNHCQRPEPGVARECRGPGKASHRCVPPQPSWTSRPRRCAACAYANAPSQQVIIHPVPPPAPETNPVADRGAISLVSQVVLQLPHAKCNEISSSLRRSLRPL